MQNLEACIFDLDGVIVDTAKYHYLAWRRLANELGFDLTIEDNERLKGISRMGSLNIVLEIGNVTLNEEAKHLLADKKNRWYVEYISKMEKNEILPGVKEFIHALRQNNIKIALGSASKNAHTILERLELLDCFDAIIDGNKATKAKPDPQVFLMAAAELGAAPEHCVVFEDAFAGIEAAKKAGMCCVGIGTREALPEADWVIAGFADPLPDVLSQLTCRNCA